MPSRKAWAPTSLASSALRARQWLHFLPLPLAALDTAHGLDGAVSACLGMLVTANALAFAYGLNAITDRHFDRSSEKNPLRGLAPVPTSALAAVGACGALALALAWVALGPVARLAAALSLLGSTVYSVGPRTKSVPFLGTLTNVLIFAPLLFVGVAGSVAPRIEGLVLTFAGLLLQNQLIHELADVDEDTLANDLSAARLIGRRGVCIAAVGIAVVTSVSLTTVPMSELARVVACVVLVVGAALPSLVESPPRARVAHRVLALLGGALVFLLARGVA